MIFKCKNCGGNAIYDPKRGTLYCPHCESTESQERVAGTDVSQCPNCGAPLSEGEFTSACKCPNCGTYLIFDERIENEWKPNLILPFKIGKKDAITILRKEFGRRVFTPSAFMSNASLDKIEGTYVPFFMYDFDGDADYHAVGTKVRVWTTGDTEYTETSYYNVERSMDVSFKKIPADASKGMDDEIMDLMEPYNYSALLDFEEKYMSGFYAEKYSNPSATYEGRAENKAREDTRVLLRNSVSGYSTLTQENEAIRLDQTNSYYVLLPVWIYHFSFQGQKYDFHINGQTGKVIGVTPISKKKVTGYSATVFGLCLVAGILLKLLLEVM